MIYDDGPDQYNPLNPDHDHHNVYDSLHLLDNHGHVHVTDFGLSVLTHPDAVNGSWLHSEREWLPLKHMAPESMESGKMLSSRKTETFMLGCLLWEIWTNKKCWSGIHAKEACRLVIEGKRMEMDGVGRRMPFVVQELISECWLENPEERPNVENVLKRLESLGS